MRRSAINRWLSAGCLLLLPLLANAAGLGRLTIQSSLGEPLVAEIELVSLQKEELPTLAAKLASADQYRSANLQYNGSLAGMRLTIERRSGGGSYIKLASLRPVNEPFIDLLVELSWASGRITREYTALIDPPGFATEKQSVAPTTPARPATAPAPAPAARTSAPATAPVERAADGQSKEYGPIKRGETLAKVAAAVKPEGVSLEQMLVGLYRSNPDAFEKNMNRMKTGRILRVPDKEEISAISRPEAVGEIRAQAADWNKYRNSVADRAAPVSEKGSAASGRITAKVEDKAAGEPGKDVVRLSKGEPPKGGAQPKGGADRVRALEEESIAKDKALKEAQDRIAQLEKTIKDQQKLMELKNAAMASAQQSADKGAKPEAKKDEKAPAKPEAKAESPKAADAKKDEPKKDEGKKDEAKKDDAKKEEAPSADKGEQPKPKPKPVAPPPPPEPDLVDMVLDDPLYLGGGVGLVLLGGVGLWYVKRRRMAAALKAAQPAPVIMDEPAQDDAESTAVMPTMAAPAVAVGAADAVMAPGSEDVDALAEAEVYLAYGRDTQAEEILKEAQEKYPDRQEIPLKLLEIYASRKDVASFNDLAAKFHEMTGGSGENWVKAAGMGYTLDPANTLYDAGKDAPTFVARASEGGGGGADLDFDLGMGAGTTTDIQLDAGPAVDVEAAPSGSMQATQQFESMQATQQFEAPADLGAAPEQTSDVVDIGLDVSPAAEEPASEPTIVSETPLMPDFNLELPSSEEPKAEEPKAEAEAAPVAAKDPNVLDFDLALPDAEPVEPAAIEVPPVAEASKDDAGLDFKLDLGDINLSLDEPKADAAGDSKDGHWYDVQQKFDLAKAYQEMGDKDGARDILQEVLKEGDAEQQEQAKQLLETLA